MIDILKCWGWKRLVNEKERNSIETPNVSRMQYIDGLAPVNVSAIAMGYDMPEPRHTYNISFKI